MYMTVQLYSHFSEFGLSSTLKWLTYHTSSDDQINGLVQDCSISSVLAIEIITAVLHWAIDMHSHPMKQFIQVK